MSKSVIQDEMHQFIKKLEEFAIDAQLKMRIIDNIRDIKKNVQGVLSEQELRRKMVELDELFVQIRKVMEPETKSIVVNDLTVVSEEDIRNRIKEILEECSRTNDVIAQEQLNGYASYIEETKRYMEDIEKTEANYEIIINAELFSEIFHNIGRKHNNRMNEIVECYLEEVSANYDKTVGRIGNMLSGISDSRLKLRQKDLYVRWTEPFERTKQKLKSEIKELDKGGKIIDDFGNLNKSPIYKRVQKIQKKYKRKKRMPLYILLILLLFLCVGIIGMVLQMLDLSGNVISDVEEIVTEVQSTELSDTEKVSTLHQIVEGLKAINDGIDEGEKIWNTLSKIFNKVGLAIESLSLNTLPIIILIGIGIYLRNARLNKKCKAQICKVTREYLKEKIDVFWQEKQVQFEVEKRFTEIIEKVSSTYECIIEEIFGMALYDEKDGENSCISRMVQLSDEWEKIKRGNI